MASFESTSSDHEVDNRIAQIWGAIETRQFRYALKLISNFLAKIHPSSDPYMLALKARALQMMGKGEEALNFLLMAKEKLFSVDVLPFKTAREGIVLIQRVCRDLRCFHFATTTRQNLWNDLDQITRLLFRFKTHVNGFNYEDQQQRASEMYEVAGEERFLLWTVLSMQLQVFFGHAGNNLLQSAEGLLEKHIASHSLLETESLHVYISILEHQEKYKTALEILSGELGTLFTENDRLRIQGRLLACDSQFTAAAEIFKNVLEAGADDWDTFLDYLGCLLEDNSRWAGGATGVNPIHPPKYVDCKLSHLSPAVLESRMEDALCFVQRLQSENDAEFLRWPYLAKLEIERRKRLRGKSADAKLMEAFMNYFRRFGDMPSFTSDVTIFLDEEVLTDYEDMVLVESLIKSLAFPSILQVKYFEGLMTIFKIQDWSGNLFKISTHEAERSVLFKTRLYLDNLALSKALNTKKTVLNDELLCLTCSMLVQLFWSTRQLGYLVAAIMVLEFGLTIQRGFCQFKVLLVHLYTQCSALPLAYEWYKSLDIEDVRWETFSHHIFPQMLLSPLWIDLDALLSGYLSFVDGHFKDSADLTFLAFRHRNYSKVIEIARFKDQLQHSHQYLMARLERPILHLKLRSNNIYGIERVLASLNFGLEQLELSSEEHCLSLTFNDDTQSRPWWTPNRETNYLQGQYQNTNSPSQKRDAQSKQFMEIYMRKAIKRRSFLPRLIYLSIRSTSFLPSLLKLKQEKPLAFLPDDKNSELKDLLHRYARTLDFDFSGEVVRKIDGILSDQTSALEVVHILDVFDLMSFTVFMNALKLGTWMELDGWKRVDKLILKCVQAKLQYMQPIIRSPGFDLNFFIRIVSEPIAWHILIIESCIQKFPPFTVGEKLSIELLAQVISDSIESMYGTLESIINILKEQLSHSKSDKLAILLSPLQRSEHSDCPRKVFQMLEDAAASSEEALRSWNPSGIAMKIIKAQEITLTEFLDICELKLDRLKALKDDTRLASYIDITNWSFVVDSVLGDLPL
ncbi:N-acetyltransferase B complex [Macleaya cordata]|uniref:N-acetyltransferase B complex n=1 Tax=Macleaya cordata TaxID=56857 RepID=A0A200QJR7_MACCD|nr:N-acetyltransferase B complex [Macleaya cordata]